MVIVFSFKDGPDYDIKSKSNIIENTQIEYQAPT
jgi:hypothetical protein